MRSKECLVVYGGNDVATGVPIQGNINAIFAHYPPTMDDIRDMEAQINAKCNVRSVITNWLPLSKN